jgi:YHS domain-containing protein
MNRRDALAVLIGLFAALSLGFVTANASEDRLAIMGYDPVAYFTEGKPMIGDQQFRHEWDGAIYQFASAEHLALFKADPDHYIPQHYNLCTVMLSRGVKYTADPNNWVVHEGRLYLFGGPNGPSVFLADAAGIKQRADANYERLSELAEVPQQ